MSQLFLLRHAKADWAKPGMRDFERPLKKRGRRNAEAMGRAMRSAGYLPDRVICSGATRALQTWESVAKTLGADDCEVEITGALYGCDAADYLQVINDTHGSNNLLLIGHNPMMEDVAFALAGDGEEAALGKLERGFPTSGMAAIRFDSGFGDAAPGRGSLRDFLTPSDI